jgi:hypothetical protein
MRYNLFKIIGSERKFNMLYVSMDIRPRCWETMSDLIRHFIVKTNIFLVIWSYYYRQTYTEVNQVFFYLTENNIMDGSRNWIPLEGN